MYLSTDWFESHATILPIDVVSDKPHTDLFHKAVLITSSGFVLNKNVFIENPDEFRLMDQGCERGEKVKILLNNKKSFLTVTKQKTPVPPLEFNLEPAIEAFGIVFIVKNDKVVRVLDRSCDFPVYGLCNEVNGINQHKKTTPAQFFEMVQGCADRDVVIYWSNGVEEQFKPKKTDSGQWYHVWKPIPPSFDSMMVVQQFEDTALVSVEPNMLVTAPQEQSLVVEPQPRETKMEIEPPPRAANDDGDGCADFDG
jgi:hypothetical protein